MSDNVGNYEIKRSITFENNRGFALGENPQAAQPFATWQFTEDENGRRDYYWGHYTMKLSILVSMSYVWNLLPHKPTGVQRPHADQGGGAGAPLYIRYATACLD